jgi:hypothetical protein
MEKKNEKLGKKIEMTFNDRDVKVRSKKFLFVAMLNLNTCD